MRQCTETKTKTLFLFTHHRRSRNRGRAESKKGERRVEVSLAVREFRSALNWSRCGWCVHAALSWWDLKGGNTGRINWMSLPQHGGGWIYHKRFLLQIIKKKQKTVFYFSQVIPETVGKSLDQGQKPVWSPEGKNKQLYTWFWYDWNSVTWL